MAGLFTPITSQLVNGRSGVLRQMSCTELLACCASRRWALHIDAGGPYPDLDKLLATSDAEIKALSWRDVTEALAAHPRIGDRPPDDGTEAEWSRQEQSTAVGAEAELAAANREYERRFDRVFLIRATGRTGPEILAELRRRLANDEVAERAEVRRELSGIVRLRLARCFE
jgi:2-oxo-4-hydroxy-4-carboxy-5-ureidoimidazoline decarboxylase